MALSVADPGWRGAPPLVGLLALADLATVSAPVKAEESRMARIIVETDPIAGEKPEVLLDEHVLPVHLAADPGASQFVERVGWALQDAEVARP